jgi:hypothetical protein
LLAVDLVLNRLILKQSALDEWCDGLNLPVKTVAGHIGNSLFLCFKKFVSEVVKLIFKII